MKFEMYSISVTQYVLQFKFSELRKRIIFNPNNNMTIGINENEGST